MQLTPTSSVCRLYVEKREGFDSETPALSHVLREQLNINSLEKVRVLNRYDFLYPGKRHFAAVRDQVFSDPVTDRVFEKEPPRGEFELISVEYLPGQFDARAEAASQAVSIILDSPPSPVRTARIFLLYGKITGAQMEAVRRYLINPVDSREAAMEVPDSLSPEPDTPPPVPSVDGFTLMDDGQLAALREDLGLAMFQEDIKLCGDYFARREKRDPTLAELRILDTYWSDHCRHTTFTTRLEDLSLRPGRMNEHTAESLRIFQDAHGSTQYCLMDLALAGMRILRRQGKLKHLEQSDEVNAASVTIGVSTPHGEEPWLLMFKNETHNHPTEIEPFGGAATCLGGAIRDPLSGRAYVYQALRLTGSADPGQALNSARPGKLPQKIITTEAARGYSSYGNQIGIATGYVQEIYHPGFEAKRMEVGAVVGAVPRARVRREKPVPGDIVLLVGGATGRDGIGGATGSSKKHDSGSLVNAAAEVQKGNPPEERALQRFFREPEVAGRIKKSNDFGAGGVSVAVGELAEGLEIDLDVIPKKYEGLDGLELALSESQERMAIVVGPADVEYCVQMAGKHNLQATPVARVTADKRLVMRWRGDIIASISRDFLDSSGASRSARACIELPSDEGPFDTARYSAKPGERDTADFWRETVHSLGTCSRHGLVERFDATIGARTVLMPFGGANQLTPAEAMAAKIPVPRGETRTVSIMSAGYDPYIAQWSPYHGGVYAVVEAVSRAVASGASPDEMYLTLQEYFERLEDDPLKWGKPAAALLGALRVQLELGIAAIGGKDSMSGSFEELHVPPTLAAFAVAPGKLDNVLSPEFKNAGDQVVLLDLPIDRSRMIDLRVFRELLRYLHGIIADGLVSSCRGIRTGGIISAISEMAFGNMIGLDISGDFRPEAPGKDSGGYSPLRYPKYGSFILELPGGVEVHQLPQVPDGVLLRGIGTTIEDPVIRTGGEILLLEELLRSWEAPLEEVFPTRAAKKAAHAITTGNRPAGDAGEVNDKTYLKGQSEKAPRSAGAARIVRPLVCIPVFPGTNCEDESAWQFENAGAEVEQHIFRSKSLLQVEESIEELAAAIRRAQILMIPGGFSAGDEPEGAGKYIAAVLRSPKVMEAVTELLQKRDGLVLGICNGFQALVRTGLLPFGEYRDSAPGMPTLGVNTIGRHVSRYVRTVVTSSHSPWAAGLSAGDIHAVPVSHGEGRFMASNELIGRLYESGQIAFRYCDDDGKPTMIFPGNPNGSAGAIEGITSPDGRILGKMGHSERIGSGITLNIPGNKDQELFSSAVRYFTA